MNYDIVNITHYFFLFRFEPKLSVKEYVKRNSHFYFTKLEATIFTNWVWGPRQNKKAIRSIIKPIDKKLFDDKNKRLIPKVITMWKYYSRTLLRLV